jgi:hypothetical protein
MSYRVNRANGYQPWGVTNPWVFADYGQPQRLRGGPSPLVYMSQPTYLRSEHLNPRWPYFPSSHLGENEVSSAEARAIRMERLALAGVTLSAISLYMAYHRSKKVSANKRRRGRRR